MRFVVSCSLALALLLGRAAPSDAADTQQVVDSTYDVVLLRPLGAVGLVVGSALFVPGALIASPMGWTGGIEEVYEPLVRSQYDDLVTRPLGDF